MQIELPAVLVAMVRKTHRFERDVSSWPHVAHEKIWAYGFQQLLNDAAASGKTPDEIIGLVEKRIDNLSNGVMRAVVLQSGDPIEREAMKIARAMVLKAVKEKGLKAKASEITALAEALVEKNPAIREQAQRNVEGVADLGVTVDLGELTNDESGAFEEEDEPEEE